MHGPFIAIGIAIDGHFIPELLGTYKCDLMNKFTQCLIL